MSRSFHWESVPPPVHGGDVSLGMWEALLPDGSGDTHWKVYLSHANVGWLTGVRDSHPPGSEWHDEASELLEAIAEYGQVRIVATR